MSSDDGVVRGVISALADALSPLEAITGPAALDELLATLGYVTESTSDVADAFVDASTTIARLGADVDAEASTTVLVADVVDAMVALGDLAAAAVGGSAAPFDDPAFWSALPEQLVSSLLGAYLERNAPGWFGVLSFLGVIESTAIEADRDTGAPAYIARTVDWTALINAVTAPHSILLDVYGWGATFDHQRFVRSLDALVGGVGGFAKLTPLHPALTSDMIAPDNPDRRGMQQLVAWPPAAASTPTVQTAVVVSPLPPADDPSSAPVGVLVSPLVTGAAATTIPLVDGVSLTLGGDFQVAPVRLGLRPSGATEESAVSVVDVEARIDIEPSDSRSLGGDPAGSRFELDRAHLSLGAHGSHDDLEVVLDVGLDEARFIVDLASADSFLSSLIGSDPIEAPVSLPLTWSSRDGLTVSGGAAFAITIPVDLSIAGLATVSEITIALDGDGGTANLLAAVSGSAAVGPLAVSFDRLGVEIAVEPRSFADPGNFGLVDLGVGFKPPDGLGIGVDLGVVAGGGYLFVDAEAGSYEGVLELEIMNVGISAVAIIDTQLPDVDGWSMFFALFLDLPSIQLGFGFTLTGVGGVAGINRAIDVDALGSAVRSGSLDAILFPEDPIADAPIIIDEFRAIFPPADDSYVFGPIVRIGWGTPTLIEAQLGIVIQLPDPIVIVVLGSIAAVLPTPDVELIELHLDVAGVINVDEGTLSIDASLHDSHVVGFALSGDMALRADFADAQEFLLSVGGFHPRFDPPSNFPALRRVTFGISAGSILRVDFQSYFAITSNSVQAGAEFTLEADVAGFGVYGSCGFDAMVEFSPFRIITSVHFEVNITAVGVDLMGVMLYASVEGPNRWHVIGTAEFEVLGIGKDIRVDELIGPSENEPPVPAARILDDLIDGLEIDDAWGVIQADDPAVTLREIDDPTDPLYASLFATPDATIEVRQTIVPLGITVEQYGNAPVGEHSTFDLDSIGLTSSGTLDDWFAPGRFFALSKTEKLEGPEFEQLRSGLQFGGGDPTAGPARLVTTGYKAYVIDPEFDDEVVYEPYDRLVGVAGVSIEVGASSYTVEQSFRVDTRAPAYVVVDDDGTVVGGAVWPSWSQAYVESSGRHDLHIEAVDGPTHVEVAR